MKKVYIVPSMRARFIKPLHILADSDVNKSSGNEGDEGGAKSSSVSFDDWDDSKD